MNNPHHAYFNDKSDIYRDSRPVYPPELIQYVASLARQHQLAWDCAAGNGQAAVGLARYFDAVMATDVSENQVAHALSHPKVAYSVGSAENPGFADDSLDLIVVAQALHWFDHEQFWPEVRRTLKSGGAFAAWGYDWFRICPQLDRVIETSILQPIRSFWAPQNRLLWDGYRDVKLDLQPIQVPEFTLTMDWDLDQLFGYIHSWSATRRCMEQQGDGFFKGAYGAARAAWGDAGTVRQVTMPIHLLAGRNE